MQGKILGYSSSNGVILTEAGERFPFMPDDWKEEDAPERGQLVDFVVANGRAQDVYRALGSVKGAPNTPSLTATRQILNDSAALSADINKTLQTVAQRDDLLGQIVTRVRAMPQIMLAAIMLFAALAMTFLSIGYENPSMQQFGYGSLPSAVSLTGLSSEADAIRETIELKHDEITKIRDQLDTVAQSDVGRSAPQMEMRATLERVSKAMSKLERLLGLSWIAWVVPVLCIAVIGFGWMQYSAAKPVGMVLGALSIAVAAYPYLLVRFTTELVNANTNPSMNANTVLVARRAAQKVASLDTGGWVIALCGIGCIFVALLPSSASVKDEW